MGFARIELPPGASKTITFAAPMSLLAYTGLSGKLVMDPGEAWNRPVGRPTSTLGQAWCE
jgi:hypothetical protein